MAIKVKHEGNVASRVASSAAGGAAKRAMEAAAFAKGRDIQQKQAAAAHASAPHASAQLISAPTGAGAVGGAAHAGLIGGGGGIGAQGGNRIRTPFDRARGVNGGGTAYSRGSGASDGGLVKVTGSSQFDRPDDASVWNPIKGRWEREYLPGEYEAEAKDRIMRAEYGWKQAALNKDAAREKVAADEAQERRNKEYTFKQKADWANLEQAYQDAAASGRYTPQELEVLRTQVDLQKANIKGNPFEALEPKQTAQQDIDSRLVMVNGQQMYRNSKGDLELIPEKAAEKTDMIDDKTLAKLVEQYSTYYDETEGKDVQRSPEEVAGMIKQVLDIKKQLYPQAQQAQPTYNQLAGTQQTPTPAPGATVPGFTPTNNAANTAPQQGAGAAQAQVAEAQPQEEATQKDYQEYQEQ